MFSNNEKKFGVLFMSLNELEEIFEQQKPKKISEKEMESYNKFKSAYENSVK